MLAYWADTEEESPALERANSRSVTSLSASQMQEFLQVALSAVRNADAYIREELVRGFKTKQKQDGSFVTNVDVQTERMLRSEIERAFPDHAVTGEELGPKDTDSDFRWFIDPIDGTLDFKLGLPSYGTILFLCHKSRPVVSVINHPSLGLVFHATLGRGAFANGKRIHTGDAPRGRLEDELIATGDVSAFRLSGSITKYKSLLNRHPLVRTVPGCFGHTLAAQGSVGAMVDFYLNYWDYGATELLIQEAGGKFLVSRGKQLPDGRFAYNMICGKPRVVNWLRKTIFA